MLYVVWSCRESGIDLSRSDETSFSFKNVSFTVLEHDEDDSLTCNNVSQVEGKNWKIIPKCK